MICCLLELSLWWIYWARLYVLIYNCLRYTFIRNAGAAKVVNCPELFQTYTFDMTHGFILGKFAPFHKGHEYLVEKAQSNCERLTVVVYSSADDEIPGWLRYHWVKNTFPELDVRHLVGGDVVQYLQSVVQMGSPVLFDSGVKYLKTAQALGFLHQNIDPNQENYPVSSAEIRVNPQVNWELLPRAVRPHYIRRIALVGPESCGKSYLAQQLARHFDTVFVEEYGRTYCEKYGMDSTELDFAHVAGGQLYREDEMAMEANRLLFCDTELIVTQVWSEVYFEGNCQPWIYWANHARRYDLFLLCAPDIPWMNDGLREFEGQREWMFARLKDELEARGLPFRVIQGAFAERTALAVRAVDSLLGLR